MHKIPGWLRKIPTLGYGWVSLNRGIECHDDSVTAVVFSPDGKHVASSSIDKTIKLWDTSTGNLQKTLKGHGGYVRTVVFSPDSKKIASSSHDATVKLWDVATGDLQKTLEGHYSFTMNVAFSPNGEHIAFGCYDKTVKLWGVTTCELRKTLVGHKGYVTTVAFSPDGRQIASGSRDQTIKLWNAMTGQLQKTLEGHDEWLTTVAFSSDGKQIASGSYDGIIKVWDIAESLKASKYLGHRLNRLWKFRSGQEIKTPTTVYTIKFTANNRYLKTDRGLIEIKNRFSDGHDATLESIQDIHISDEWIYLGDTRLLCLPSDCLLASDDVQDDQLAIGYENGGVLMFKIDRSSLQSMTRDTSSMATLMTSLIRLVREQFDVSITPI